MTWLRYKPKLFDRYMKKLICEWRLGVGSGLWSHGEVCFNLITRKPGTRVPVLIPDGYPGTKIPETPSTSPEFNGK